ncbi:hypothetical protein [Litchfieldella qijiaojingensis]|nr:hypothetical protein [Halomonas qijiaojingensis]
MTIDLANQPFNVTPACGVTLRAPLAGRSFWYWGYWFSAGVPAARSD